MLEDNIAKTLFDMNCGNIFLDPLPRVMKIKLEMEQLNIKLLYSKENHKQNSTITYRLREDICKLLD